MSNFSKFPFVSPFKWLPNTATPSIHFHDSWACEQIKSFEQRAYYTQKWLAAVTTKLQCISTVAPDPLVIVDANQIAVKTIAWAIAAPGSTYNAWELTFDISDLPDGIYWLYQKFELLSYKAEFITEAISLKDSHPFVKQIKYRHSKNDYDVVWTTGIEMTFCVECEIMSPEFEAELTSFADQTRDVFVLDGVPYITYQAEFFDAKGGAPYMLDIINRIFVCDNVKIEGKGYVRNTGAKLKTTKVKNYPLFGGTLEIVEAQNLYSQQHNDLTELAPGVVTAYDIDTSFFGLGEIVPITEINQS